jgi:predicted TIM-barrel fold metal-dependent hydrolase
MRTTSWGRRDVLKAMSAGAAVAVIGAAGAAAQPVKWSEGTEPPKLKAPANACDCHHHIYDAKYPVDPKATLRPGEALVEDYRAFQKRIGTSRHVVVTPSTYGVDNRVTLDAVAAFGPQARAVVVVNDTVSDAELKRMHDQGARGIRFNLAQAGATTPEMIEPLSKRVNELGWHIQINAAPEKIQEIMPILQRVPSPIVFDHLAHIPEPEGVNHPLFGQVRALIDKGRTWVKLSGAYADTKIGPPTYADSTAVAQAYAKAAPERCVWGSDWPHPLVPPLGSQPQPRPDDAVAVRSPAGLGARRGSAPPHPGREPGGALRFPDLKVSEKQVRRYIADPDPRKRLRAINIGRLKRVEPSDQASVFGSDLSGSASL